MVTISDKEIAKLYQISEEHVREYVRWDVKAGMIIEVHSRSTYYLTFQGLHVLCQMNPSSLEEEPLKKRQVHNPCK